MTNPNPKNPFANNFRIFYQHSRVKRQNQKDKKGKHRGKYVLWDVNKCLLIAYLSF